MARGIRIHHLNIGQPDFATPEPIRAAITGFARQTVAYAPSQGLPEAVAAIDRIKAAGGTLLSINDRIELGPDTGALIWRLLVALADC